MSDVSQPPRRRSYWLIASLCLNFFLIGVVVTGLVVARGRMIANAMSGGGGGALPPEVVLEMLPRTGAIKMCDTLAARVENFRRLGKDVLDARREVFKAFRTEPFDAAGFQTVLDRQTNAQFAILKERQAAITEVVSKLTPDERHQFTRELVRRFFAQRPAAPRNAGRLREMCEAIGAGSATALPR